jgi:hypothetical protein
VAPEPSPSTSITDARDTVPATSDENSGIKPLATF